MVIRINEDNKFNDTEREIQALQARFRHIIKILEGSLHYDLSDRCDLKWLLEKIEEDLEGVGCTIRDLEHYVLLNEEREELGENTK